MEHYAECGRSEVEIIIDALKHSIAEAIADCDWLMDASPAIDSQEAKELAFTIRVGGVCP